MPTEKCDLIREGAPFPPDPPSKTWRPDDSVSCIYTALCSCFCESFIGVFPVGGILKMIKPFVNFMGVFHYSGMNFFSYNYKDNFFQLSSQSWCVCVCVCLFCSRISSSRVLVSRLPSAAISTELLRRRKTTVTRFWSAMPMSSATLCAGEAGQPHSLLSITPHLPHWSFQCYHST